MQRIIICVLLFLSVRLGAQSVQEGIVVELNSGGKPVAGVSVIAVGAIPTDSDQEGKFRLVFSRAVPGAKIVASRIYKEGYEIVNTSEIGSWVLSDKVSFRIVMCREGQLEESRRNFYDIGRDRYYTLYGDARKRLERQMSENKLSEGQYADSLENLLAMYEDNMRRLDYYADKFSRINKDELSELDERALDLMERGAVDEAIAVYEEAEILRVFRDKTAQADTISSNIAVLTESLFDQVRLLLSLGGQVSHAKADSILLVLEKHGKGRWGMTLGIAEFRMSMGQYDKAFDLLYSELPLCRDREAGEKMAATLIRSAEYLDEVESGNKRLNAAETQIKEWRSNRALRTILE